MKFAGMTIVAALAAAIAGCSSPSNVEVVSTAAPIATAGVTPSGPQANTSTPAAITNPQTKSPEEAIEAFMDAMGSASDPEVMREAATFAKKGSPAFVYMTHQANPAEAQLDAGLEMVDDDITRNPDGSFESCDSENECVTFSDFKADADGKLVDLTVGGKAIAPRLVVGNGKDVKFGSSKITLLTAYRSVVSNNLLITLRVETSAKSVELFNGSYRGADKKVRDIGSIAAPQEIAPDSSTLALVVVPGMKPDGTLSLTGLESNVKEVNAMIRIG